MYFIVIIFVYILINFCQIVLLCWQGLQFCLRMLIFSTIELSTIAHHQKQTEIKDSHFDIWPFKIGFGVVAKSAGALNF